MTLTYLGIIRWTRPAVEGSGLDPDHVLSTLCGVVLLTTGALVVMRLGPHPEWGTWGPGSHLLVSMAGSAVAVTALLVTTRGALRRGDPRPALMVAALVVCLAVSAAVLADAVPRIPWGALVRAPWLLAIAVCAALPEVTRPADRQDVAISSITSYVLVALGLPVVAVALVQGMTTVAALAALATAGAVARLLLDVRELLALISNRSASLVDELTGLPNRRGTLAALERAITAEQPLVVAVVDLDHFKEVNDSLGHAVGDALLQAAAARIGSVLQPGEVAGRLGGDEFVVVAPAPSPRARAARLGSDLARALGRPVSLHGISVPLGASVGTSTWQTVGRPDDGDGGSLEGGGTYPSASEAAADAAGRLLRAADTAMYDAKRTGSGWVSHDPVHHDDPAQQLALVADLRAALAARQLVLHHQPQVCAATGYPAGAEALVRWPHPSLGLLAPARFLDLAEAHGLMGPLTDEVLRAGVEQQAAWRAQGLRVRLALNLPASALHDVELPSRVRALLAEHGVGADAVVLEVTESVLLKDPERSSAVVGALRASGVRVSIDDFGTGFSSLARLRNLAVDELKLDASFTGDLLVDARARTIVASSVQLAHALEMTVVAEGVEDAETLEHLVRLGCDEVQGYVFAAPMPADELAAWWRERTSVEPPADAPRWVEPASSRGVPPAVHRGGGGASGCRW
ncbi:bifunctional diguanylate cyclase/phosphodiesterase [Quadrisphaera sp. INWT6]|uniref:putative bifunctional diguanylate cyclase/phosphodiesterase n=1 Tax=Quadrisphaera sp. INWT6 TaxID=2596917 RepID=UPI0018922E39|nr:bifunctional diguanylate cyclase/phosphodiesterase [Quadrisphaera sp. INWT6]